MPHIYKRGDVLWYSFTVDGRRYRRSAGTLDRRQAEDIAVKDEWQQRQAAVHGVKEVITFAQALAIYVRDGRDTRFTVKLLDRWGKTPIKDITPPEIRQAAVDLYPKAKPATRNRQCIVVARAVINHAAEQGLCPHIRVRKFPEGKRPNRRAGSRVWIDMFCANATTPEIGALARFMFETGTRITDAVNLKWEDVNLQERTAFFPKTKNGDGHVAMLPFKTIAALANLPKDRKKVFGFASRHSVARQWAGTIKAAGIQPLTRHEAGRHGFGTELIVRNGVDIPTAAKLGNWKSHRLLSETYAHPENERATLDRVFGGRNKG